MLWNIELNLIPMIICIPSSILVASLMYYLKLPRWFGPADTIYAAHHRAGILDLKGGFGWSGEKGCLVDNDSSLRQKDDKQELHDINTIMFVAIHELAHLMTKEIGHTPRFWDNMKYLLEKASSVGIYTPVDYGKNPQVYCGMEINSTPMKV